MRSLIDTNILVYARDVKEGAKHSRAVQVIDELAGAGELVLSVQSLNEFTAVALKRGGSAAEARASVERWMALGEVLPIVPAATTAALAWVERYRLSFWDALIWVTARNAGVPVVLSEDFQHGREIEASASSTRSADLRR